MLLKRPIIPINDQGHISRLCLQLTPNLLYQPERICNAKGTESKRDGNQRLPEQLMDE